MPSGDFLRVTSTGIPVEPPEAPPHSPSQPLTGLNHHAPQPNEQISILNAGYVISNDDLAATFGQVQAREFTPLYQRSENRTAVLVGESALMASIRHIPEETIIMLDRAQAMVDYMARYVTALRASGDIEEWYENMGFNNNPNILFAKLHSRLKMLTAKQAEYWQRAGYEHPAASDDAFGEASELARQKVIVPWRADLASGRDMRRLGKVLRAHKASVTLLNMTNVLVCEDRLRSAAEAADLLEPLPLTPEAPILVTTAADFTSSAVFPIAHPARLFFGLKDLREHGGTTDSDSSEPGPAISKVIRS